jgi:hypothetical protein
MRSLSHTIHLLKQPLYSLSKIAFCAFGLIFIVYFLRKFFTKQKDQPSDEKNPPINNQSSIQNLTSLRIILNPTPEIDLLNEKISFEIESIKYIGTVDVRIDGQFVFNEKADSSELFPTLKKGMNEKIEMLQNENQSETYLITCDNPDKTFSYDKILSATNWSIIPEKINHSQRFSLLPSCTLL